MASSVAIDGVARSQHRRGQVFVALAAVAWSSAGVLQREMHIGLGTQVAGRAFFAFVALAVFVVAGQRRELVSSVRRSGWAMLGAGVSMAIASASFIIALNYTSVAHVLFLQASSPILAALLGRMILGEAVSPRAWVAMLVALAGVGVMMGAPGGGLVNLLSVLMALSFAVSIIITRSHRHISMAPAACLAQVLILVFAVPFAHPGSVDGRNLVLLILLGAGQIGLGLALLSIGARLIPAAEIATITLLEVVLGPLWVWMAVSEQPSTATLIGGAIVVAGVLLQAGAEQPERAQPAATTLNV